MSNPVEHEPIHLLRSYTVAVRLFIMWPEHTCSNAEWLLDRLLKQGCSNWVRGKRKLTID